MELSKFLHRIKSLDCYSNFTPILEGYSSDKKYLVECNGQNFLLRTFSPDVLSRKSDERFIEDHAVLMIARPNRFQHDDFHIKNLVVNGRDLSGIIDFGRFDWGDPVHEFLKVGQFSSEVSIPFSVGQIHGYFASIQRVEAVMEKDHKASIAIVKAAGMKKECVRRDFLPTESGKWVDGLVCTAVR